MITPEGRVYEDIGSGSLRGGKKYPDDWWCENHAGCLGSGEAKSNNKKNGSERKIRSTYNPLCQFLFIRNQVFASRVLDTADALKCQYLAELGWKYSRKAQHDGRTLFVAEELLAACELYASGLAQINGKDLEGLADELMKRQETGDFRLSGYFYEKNKTDGYRSIVWNAEPAMALLRVCELGIPGMDRPYQTNGIGCETIYRKLLVERCCQQSVLCYSVRRVRKSACIPMKSHFAMPARAMVFAHL